MRTFLMIFLLSATLQGGQAQDFLTEKDLTGKLRKRFESAQQAVFNGQQGHARGELEKLLEKEPRCIDAQLMYADLLLQQSEYAGAESAFEKALQLSPGYAGLAYVLVGEAEIAQQKYAEAKAHLQTYFDGGHSTARWAAKARALLQQATFAEQAVKEPVPFEPKALPAAINTENPEYLPALSADGRYLVYTSRTTPRNEDIFISEYIDGQWQPGLPVAALNSPFNESSPSLSADGQAMAFARDGRDGNFDLYYARKRNGRWEAPALLPPPVNTSAFESQPSLSADGTILLFVSDRPGGQGQLDIWATRMLPDGSWREPQNLGTPINTPLNEQAPFFHPDGRTLYFMSKGHPGMGSYDLFRSQLEQGGEWSKPLNLGYPINTPGNEGALTVSLDGKTAYFDSDQADPTGRNQEMGNANLYTFELYEAARPNPATYVEATVRDARTKRPLEAEVEITRLSTQKVYGRSLTNEKGQFLIVLPMEDDYALSVDKEGYFFHSAHFALAEPQTLTEPYRLLIELQPIPPPDTAPDTTNGPVVLRNIFFETGSAALQQASMPELKKLQQLLVEHPQMRIQINGHTDNVGRPEDNLALSENRAKAVRDYLATHGISPVRLQYKGFGETRPIADNSTPEGRAKNRRTEFEVL